MHSFQYLVDGHHVDDAGNLIACTYVDFRGPAERFPITGAEEDVVEAARAPGLRAEELGVMSAPPGNKRPNAVGCRRDHDEPERLPRLLSALGAGNVRSPMGRCRIASYRDPIQGDRGGTTRTQGNGDEDAADAQGAGEPRVEGRDPDVDLRCQAGPRLNGGGRCRPDAPVALVAAEDGRGERSGPVPGAQSLAIDLVSARLRARAGSAPFRPGTGHSSTPLGGCPAAAGDSSICSGADSGAASACGVGPRPGHLPASSHRVDAYPFARSSTPGLVQQAGARAGSVSGRRAGLARAGASASGDRAACQRPPQAASLRRRGAEALLAAAAITAMLAVSTPAMAQDTQVSNLAEDTDGPIALSSSLANGFTTQTSSLNFFDHLHSVDIDIARLAPESTWRPLSVSIWTATSAGVPLELIAFLERPETPEVGINSFTPAAVLPLAPGNSYAVVVRRWDGGRVNLTRSRNEEDEGSGWTIADRPALESGGVWSLSDNLGSMKFRVKTRTFTRSSDHRLSALTLRDSHDDSTVPLSPTFSSTGYYYTASVGSNVSQISLMGTSENALGRIADAADTINQQEHRVLRYLSAMSGREFQDMDPCEAGAGLTDACRDLDFTLQEGRNTFLVRVATEFVDRNGEILSDGYGTLYDHNHPDLDKTSYTLVVTRRAPLTASFTNVPNSHDGSTAFNVDVEFTENLDSDSQTALASGVSIENGSQSVDPAAQDGGVKKYRLTIQPSSAAPVRIYLRGSRNCTSTHSLCGASGSHMASGPSATVSVGTDAMLESIVLSSPLIEPGAEEAMLQLEWSEAFDSATYSYEVDSPILRQLSVTATPNTPGAKITLSGEGVATTSEFTGTAESEWPVPDAGGTLTVMVTSPNGNVTQTYTVEVTENPANLYVKAAGAYERPGAELQFSVELRPERIYKVTVDYATSDGTAKAGSDYEATDGELTFEPGETLKQVTVAVHDDDDNEVPEWMRLKLSNASGALARSSAFGLITNSELTATFENLPGMHDGTNTFTFRIAFNQPTTITAEAMRDHALTVDGGTVTAAAQVEDTAQEGDPPNLQNLWELTVQPSGSGDVSLLLPYGRACTEAGAVCAEDDRPLSAAVSGAVTGPDGASNTAPTGLPAISGTARVGETLTASADSIADTDGLTTATFAWQWIANDGTTDADIADATDRTYALTSAEEGKTVKVRVTFTDDGGTEETLVSDATAAVSAVEAPLAPLTAEFSGLPAEHDGSSAFTFTLTFSEDVGGLSYTTLRDSAFEVSGGSVTKASRQQQGSNRRWNITVEPDSRDDVAISLPETTDCSTAGAICAPDGRKLSQSVSATVAGPPTEPLTASFSGVPAEHDGEDAFTFTLTFSENVKELSYRTLRDSALEVTGGRVRKASRQASGNNQNWNITVEPDGYGAVAVVLPETTDCGAAGAICTPDGRKLSNSPSATVAGPVGISVDDARVDENDGALLAFVVSLSRAAGERMTVAYATSDGSAQAPADYAAAEGTLTFEKGDSSQTVSVTVRDDSHDEGEETLTLTLSNPSSGRLTDAEATGTIVNRDPLPRALLARFGRTAAVHVVEHVEERLAAPRVPGFRGRFAGRELRRGMERDMALGLLRQLGGSASVSPPGSGTHGRSSGMPAAAALGAPGPGGGLGMAGAGAMTGGGMGAAGPVGMGGPTGVAAGRMAVGGMGGAAVGPAGAGADPFHGQGLLQTALGHGDVLTGSDFALNRETRGGILSFWSRGAQSSFAGREGTLGLDGDVRTTMFGVDYARGRMVTGLSLSRSAGLGNYAGTDAGQVASAVTGLYPWLGYRASDRVTVWGVTGYGAGGMLLTPEGGPALESGLSMAMAAAGTRGELVAGGASGFELAFKADAMWVGTAVDGVDGPGGRLAATEAAVTRFRTGLEGSRDYTLASRLSLRPSVEVGLRQDGGDAETGAGMDVGGGLVVSDSATGLAVDLRVRMLLVHQAEGFRERGMALSLSYNPTPSTPLGFNARVAPSWGGQAMSGAEALWGRETMAGMAHGSPSQGNRLDGEVGYGLPVGSRLVGTPRVGFSTSEYGRNYRVGYSLGLLDRGRVNFELGVDAQRREESARGRHGQRVPRPGHGGLVGGLAGASRKASVRELALHSFQYLADGHHVDDAGNLIACTYVDFRGPAERFPITALKKASSKRHAIPGCETIRISKPSCFLGQGEGVAGYGEDQRDPAAGGEADDPDTRTAVPERPAVPGDEVHCGHNGWIYCASIEPETREELAAWRKTLPAGYDAVSPVRRPREFARALGAMAAEKAGPRSRIVLLRNTVDGQTFCTAHKSQAVYHGPVVYLDDPCRRLECASSDLELTLLLVFAKHAAHRAQREYRFLLWAEDDPAENVVDLAVAPALVDAMWKPRQEPEGSGFVRPGPEEYSAVEDLVGFGTSVERARVEAQPALLAAGSPMAAPRSYDGEDLPGELHETATAGAVIEALRGPVDRAEVRCRKDAAAAAWHAAPVVRYICATYGAGIAGVQVSDNGFITITVELTGDGPVEASIAVGPDGSCACRISAGDTHRASTAPDVRSFGRVLKRRLEEVGVRRRDGGAG